MYAKPKLFADHAVREGRSARTFEQIESVFREMLATRPFAEISVKEIAATCGIARTTVYRKWAGTADLLWAAMRGSFEQVIVAAFAGDLHAATEALTEIWNIPGGVPAIVHESVAPTILKKIAALVAAELERRCPEREANTCGLVIAGAIMAFLNCFPTPGDFDKNQAQELVFVIYVSGFMTPKALEAAVRDRNRSIPRRFPPAVSVRESLASDDYIISLLDGRPYRSLKRHLSRFGLTPEEYRHCFGLPADYPLVARSYSAKRSELAKMHLRRRPAHS